MPFLFKRFFSLFSRKHLEQHSLERLHHELASAVEGACSELDTLGKDAVAGLSVRISPPLSLVRYVIDPALPEDAELSSAAVRAGIYEKAIEVQRLVRQGKLFAPSKTRSKPLHAIPDWAEFVVLLKRLEGRPKFFFASAKGVSKVLAREKRLSG